MTEMTTDDDKSKHTARGLSYQTLSALYYPPREDFGEIMTALQENLSHCYSELAPYADDLLTEFNEQRRDLTEMQVDHARLFLGPTELLAAPYGSVYLDEGRTIMGDSTMEAKKHYQAVGLKPSDDIKQPPDFIATELEFLFFLIHCHLQAEDAEAAGEFLERQRAFLNQHLGRWVEPFTELMIKEAGTEFYKILGVLTQNFIKAELVSLPELELQGEQ